MKKKTKKNKKQNTPKKNTPKNKTIYKFQNNAFLILRMQNKARASIWLSSTATGGENGLKIRVYGTKGAVEWFQDDPNHLQFTELNKSTKNITRANNEVSNFSLESSRLAAGHPEGFFEAFANIYTEFADTINGYRKQKNKKDW